MTIQVTEEILITILKEWITDWCYKIAENKSKEVDELELTNDLWKLFDIPPNSDLITSFMAQTRLLKKTCTDVYMKKEDEVSINIDAFVADILTLAKIRK